MDDLFSECFPTEDSASDSQAQQDIAGTSEELDLEKSAATSAMETDAPGVDPGLALVVETVKNAGHLSERCSTMLANMLPFSLAIPADQRLEGQHKVVSMAEETMKRIQVDLDTAAAASHAKCESLEATLAELHDTVKDADAEFATWSARWRVSLDEASAVANSSAHNLAEAQEAQAIADARLASLREEISGLMKAFQVHFQKPLKAGKGPNFQELEPFLQDVEMEQPALEALPGICAKSPTKRSDEEHAILEQLEMAIAVKISKLTEAVETEAAASADRATAVKNAEVEYTSKKQVRDRSTIEFQAAMKEQGGGQESLKKAYKAKETIAALQPQLEAATGLRDCARTKLADFTSIDGALARFNALRGEASEIAVEKLELSCKPSQSEHEESLDTTDFAG